MFYQNELIFLCEVFKKSHINTHIVELSSLQKSFTDNGKQDIFNTPEVFREILFPIKSHTVYRITDTFEFCYRLLLLPDTETPTVFYAGPFLANAITPNKIMEIGEAHGISAQKQRYFSEYYASIPVIPNDSQLWSVFDTFCETIWKNSLFNVNDINRTSASADIPVGRSMHNLKLDDTLVNIKAVERRYSFENEMIRAVLSGKVHMETKFQSVFSTQFFEKRHSDPIRNAKNYAVIMNTLLRKAAEQGGVHPLHLDQISSEFALKIESFSSITEISTLMCEMFRTYCYLVRKHSLQSFSPIVQNTLLMIDVDLSTDLSPSALAEAQNISLGYLSTVFKKETKETLSSYIRKKRMAYAAHLLDTTKLQIQTVALHCGIMDSQYFSKLFKAHHKITPSEYRVKANSKV